MSDNETNAETATTREVSILDISFEISQPFVEGHQLTAAEAKVLNQTRAENVCNNMRKKIKDALAEENPDLDAIKSMVAEYDEAYEFTLGSTTKTAKDPLEVEAIKIAREMLTAKIKAAGMTVKAYKEAKGEDNYDNKLAEIAENEQIIALARKRLADKEEIANIAI